MKLIVFAFVSLAFGEDIPVCKEDFEYETLLERSYRTGYECSNFKIHKVKSIIKKFKLKYRSKCGSPLIPYISGPTTKSSSGSQKHCHEDFVNHLRNSEETLFNFPHELCAFNCNELACQILERKMHESINKCSSFTKTKAYPGWKIIANMITSDGGFNVGGKASFGSDGFKPSVYAGPGVKFGGSVYFDIPLYKMETPDSDPLIMGKIPSNIQVEEIASGYSDYQDDISIVQVSNKITPIREDYDPTPLVEFRFGSSSTDIIVPGTYATHDGMAYNFEHGNVKLGHLEYGSIGLFNYPAKIRGEAGVSLIETNAIFESVHVKIDGLYASIGISNGGGWSGSMDFGLVKTSTHITVMEAELGGNIIRVSGNFAVCILCSNIKYSTKEIKENGKTKSFFKLLFKSIPLPVRMSGSLKISVFEKL